ncbi:hypothetical protein LXA43DRAFT_733594 [Ganoderma leucocontextum]|nr:hypothetical protein LXA43DRAFT_733594 [Ganoderma leucocontextum]
MLAALPPPQPAPMAEYIAQETQPTQTLLTEDRSCPGCKKSVVDENGGVVVAFGGLSAVIGVHLMSPPPSCHLSPTASLSAVSGPHRRWPLCGHLISGLSSARCVAADSVPWNDRLLHPLRYCTRIPLYPQCLDVHLRV